MPRQQELKNKKMMVLNGITMQCTQKVKSSNFIVKKASLSNLLWKNISTSFTVLLKTFVKNITHLSSVPVWKMFSQLLASETPIRKLFQKYSIAKLFRLRKKLKFRTFYILIQIATKSLTQLSLLLLLI